jgi:hypothetical protein
MKRKASKYIDDEAEVEGDASADENEEATTMKLTDFFGGGTGTGTGIIAKDEPEDDESIAARAAKVANQEVARDEDELCKLRIRYGVKPEAPKKKKKTKKPKPEPASAPPPKKRMKLTKVADAALLDVLTEQEEEQLLAVVTDIECLVEISKTEVKL